MVRAEPGSMKVAGLFCHHLSLNEQPEHLVLEKEFAPQETLFIFAKIAIAPRPEFVIRTES
jgi:hypothetical protein